MKHNFKVGQKVRIKQNLDKILRQWNKDNAKLSSYVLINRPEMQDEICEIKAINKEIGSKDVDVVIVKRQNKFPQEIAFPVEAIEIDNIQRLQMLELENEL